MSLFLRCLLIIACLSGAASVRAEPVRELLHADFLLADVATPPAADDTRWHPVALPHMFGRDSLNEPGGWFRLKFSAASAPSALHAIYIWRLNLNVAVYFNGHYLGDGGRFTEPVARNWNYPQYFVIPPALWRVGVNEIWVRLKTQPGWGMLSPLNVGPDVTLRPRYEMRRFFQIELTAAFALTLAVSGVMVLGIWWRRRQDRQYFWFALSCLFWSVFAVYLFVRNPVIPGEMFRWFALVSLNLWVFCLALFVRRYLGYTHGRGERVYFLLLAGMLLPSLALPIYEQSMLFRLVHLVSLCVVFGLAWVATQRWRRTRHREAGVLTLALWALALAGVHDTVLNLPLAWLPLETLRASMRFQFHLLHFMAPMVLFFLIWHLTRRFVAGLNAVEGMNTELERRVEKAQTALEAGFQARRVLELQRAASEERERIYQDLHDDIGAKLLSLVIGAEHPAQAETARAALQELRDVVSHSGRDDIPLTHVLGDLRAECERRLSAGGLTMEWVETGVCEERILSSAASLNLTRIVREALSNILRHAAARLVRIQVTHSASDVSIDIEDDGHGLSGTGASSGRGMRNMTLRAGRLGGEIAWQAGDVGGCRVSLRVPFASGGVRTPLSD